MTSPIYLLILGEIALVGATAAIVLSLFSRRRKKNIMSSLESLLRDIKKSEAERKQSFLTQLSDGFRLADEHADNLSDQLLQNEKGLFQSFIRTQLLQSPETFSELQKDISRLTDDCLDLLEQNLLYQHKPAAGNPDRPTQEDSPDVKPTDEEAVDEVQDNPTPDTVGEDQDPVNLSSSQEQPEPENPATDEPEDSDPVEVENSSPPETEEPTTTSLPPADAADDVPTVTADEDDSRENDDTADEIPRSEQESDQSVGDQPNPDEPPEEAELEIEINS